VSIDQPTASDRPSRRLEVVNVPDTIPDPRQYEGRFLTPEFEHIIKYHKREPWDLDKPVGKDESAGEVLRRHHGGDLPKETVERNADYIATQSADKPWLAKAADADPLVQAIYVERDQSVGHDLERHEGWRALQGQYDRALYQRDPAHATDSPEYLRSNDAFGEGRLHACWGYATHIPDPVAYATAYARIAEYPKVKAALSTPFNPEKDPQAIRDLPIDEVLGPNGHTAIYGYELVGDDMRASTANRRDFVRAIRAEIDDGSTPDEALEKVRSSLHERNLTDPTVRGIDSFAGGTFTVQFDANRTEDGYEILSFYASPRRDEQ
jgi:hypothetical protein